MIPFAVCGADGSGKTTWINSMFTSNVVIHALPKMKVFSVVDSKWKRIATEILMGLERVIQSWKAKIGNYQVMDRCYICGETYAMFWAEKFNEPLNYKISLAWNKLAWKPDAIILFMPDYGKAKPRKNYSEDDIALLTKIYTEVLTKYEYESVAMMCYGFGTQLMYVRKGRNFPWSQVLNFSSIRGKRKNSSS